MSQLFATLHTLGVRVTASARDRLRARDGQEGSVTIEQVVWAVAVIAIAAIVVTAIKSYVTSQAGLIR